jgi:hypothetical protein
MLTFRTSMPSMTLSVLMLCCFAGATASADEPDGIAAKLAEARIAYEHAMEDIREDALKAIDKREADLRAKAKPSAKGLAETQEQIKKLGEERSAFQSSGDWPSIPASDGLKRRAKTARMALLRAYERAQADYVKAKNDALAETIQREHEQLLTESDIVPWGGDLLANGSEGQRLVGPTKQTIDLGEIVSDAYRIEIVAKRTQGDGPLRIVVPLPNGEHACFRTSGSAAESRMVLTVRQSLSSADLGAVADSDVRPGNAAAKEAAKPVE